MKMIYVSGKYTDDTPEKVNENIRLAAIAAVALWRMGWGVYCPHTATAHLEFFGIKYDDILHFDLQLIRSRFFYAMFMLPNWSNSKGAKRELEVAKEIDLKVVYSLHDAQMLMIMNGLKGPGIP